jgi:hypothetical protein
MGGNWHLDCWRCSACGKPIRGPFAVQDDQPYHPPCHAERFGLRCFFCGQAFTGTFVVNSLGQRACRLHDHGPACASCGRWLGPEECLQRADPAFATVLCRPCRVRAVGTRELQDYGNPFGTAALGELGLQLRLAIQVPIRLETLARIRQLNGPGQAQAEGITQTQVETLDGRETVRSIREIIVAGGLAREHFEGILAHEFGHVWLFHRKLDRHAGLVAEGFCELVKHRWLTRLGTPLARELQRKQEDNPDPVYGNGFRLLRQHWDRAGSQGVLDLLGP